MSAGSGVVSVRFDVTGNEQLIAALKTIATSSKGLTTEFTAMQTKINAPMGGLGPLQGLAAGVTAAETKVTSFRGSLASIGTQLGQNATSFGVATASIWGVYNAYDSLTKVEIRAHSAAVRVSTLETTLASLTERRRLAVEKGNLTGEQMAVLNERIADTQEKLSVAQERSADIAQDVQEAWVGFASQVGPQVVAAGGSIAQLFTTLTTKSPEGISALTKLKTSFTTLFSSLGGAGGSLVSSISNAFSGITSGITGTTKSVGPLDNAMKGARTSSLGLTSGLLGIGLTAAGIGLVTAGVIELGFSVNNVVAGFSRVKEPVSVLSTFVDKSGKSMREFNQSAAETKAMLDAGVTPAIVALDAAFGTHMTEDILRNAGALDSEGKIIVDVTDKVSDLGAGFTATKADYIEWATNLLKSGKTAGQVFDFLRESKIKEADSTEIQIAANEAYQESLAKLGISTERYNEIGTKANDVIKMYIDRVKTGNVPLSSLTESIHGQVQAMVDSKQITIEEGKVLEDLVLRQLKTYGAYKNTTVAIDQARIKRFQEVDAIKASAAAYLGLNGIQGQSVGALQNFNDTVGKSIDELVNRGIELRKQSDAERLANQTTFEAVDANADYIESMINLNEIGSGTITMHIAMRNAIINGLTAAQQFITNTTLQAVELDTTTAALQDYVTNMDKITLPPWMEPTLENLQAIHKEFIDTGDSLQFFADELNKHLEPSLSAIQSVIEAQSWKDFKKNFKDLDFGDISGKLKSHFREFDNMLRKINVDAEQMSLTFSTMDVMEHLGKLTGSDFKRGMKDLADEVKDIGKLQDVDTSDISQFLIDLGNTKDPKNLEKNEKLIRMIEEAAKDGFTSEELANIRAEIDKSKADNLKKIADALDDIKTKAEGARDPLRQALLSTEPESGGTKNKKFGEMDITDAKKLFEDKWKREHPPTDIPPPKPIVFPPPDISNIIKSVAIIEQNIGSINDFVTNLKLTFAPINPVNIVLGVQHAEENLGSIIDFMTNLKLTFAPVGIENITSSIATAETDIGSIIDFVAGIKPVFPAPNIVAVVNQTSSAKKAAATLVTDMAKLKPTFPPPNIVAVVNQTSAAKKAASTLETHIAGLKLKFPKPDISQIESQVKAAQSKIDSLHGKNIENHVTTVFDNAGGNILNDAMITSAARGKLFTTNGEQLFRVGDNPGGRETIAIIPHDNPGTIMEKLTKMFPPINSILHERARRPAMQTISGHAMSTRTTASPTSVNVTTQVYLFPGSQMFKQYVKQIMLEDIGRNFTA